MEKNNNEHAIINKILNGIQDDGDNLKKSRYITLTLCKMYEYNPVYNYGNSDTKKDIFNKSYINKMKFEKYENVDYLNLNDLHKICIDLGCVYDFFLTLAKVRHNSIGSDVIIFLNNNLNSNACFLQSIVKDLDTIKTKRRPIGIITDNQEDILKRIEEIDRELGYIDEKGYIGESIKECFDKENEVDLEIFLNNASQYIKNVLKADISNVELHKYYKYLIKTSLPNKHIFIIPFLKDEDYTNIQYLLTENSNRNSENEFFLFSKEEQKFMKVSTENVPQLDGKVVGKQKNVESNLKEYLRKTFKSER